MTGARRALSRRVLLGAGASTLLAGCDTGTPERGRTSGASSETHGTSTQPSRATAAGAGFRSERLATFDEPWAMAFLPGQRDETLLVTERTGALRLFWRGSGRTVTVQGTPRVLVEGQGGLGDVVVAPDFSSSHRVYLTWAEQGDGSAAGAVMGRATLDWTTDRAALTDLHVLWRQTPQVSGRGHYGHRLAFSPDDRYLFVSSGERQKFTPAQDLTVNLGKILRLTPEGQPAPGNPFAYQGGATTRQIWTCGHRNPLGLAFAPDGRLWQTEMGPKGGDELNLIEPGGNYGWPQASNGSNYDGSDIPDHQPGDGFVAPKVSWNPSVSPGSLMIYSGSLFDWQGDALIGCLSGQRLIRVRLDGAAATGKDEWDMGARIRAVAQAPDGAVHLLTDGPGGALLRLTPP